jgi:hypothetical protein
MTDCMIIHNMIVEDEGDDSVYDQVWEFQSELIKPVLGPATFPPSPPCVS